MKANSLYIFMLVAALFIASANNLFAEENSRKIDKIEVKENRVTADVEDADLPDVLKVIEKGSGIKITVDKELLGKKITTSFENKDVEDSLREVLRGHYYVLSYTHDRSDKEKKTLKEVKAKGDVIGSKPLKGQIITFEIPYGNGKGEVGVHIGGTGEGDLSHGPTSFALDDEDNIYICDALNNGVQIYTPDGKYLSTIPLKEGTSAADIVVDKHGFVYIYDASIRKLYQYEKNGNIVASIDVNQFWHGGDPIRIKGNEIYVDDCDPEICGSYIIGRILFNKRLVPPSAQELTKLTDIGRYRASGKKTKGRKFIRGYNAQIDISDKDNLSSIMLSLPSNDIVVRSLLGEDRKGNFYFYRSRAQDAAKLWYIDEFDATGDYIGSTSMPGGDQVIFARKEFHLTRDGNVYHFVPEKDLLKVFIFHNEGTL